MSEFMAVFRVCLQGLVTAATLALAIWIAVDAIV